MQRGHRAASFGCGRRAALGLVLAAAAPLPAPLLAQGWALPAGGMAEFERQSCLSLRRDGFLSDFGARVVRSAREGGSAWRVCALTAASPPPPAHWVQPAFDDRQWSIGVSGFGGERGPECRTLWREPRICLRQRFEWTRGRPVAGVLSLRHDDGVEVLLNGASVLRESGAKGQAWHALPPAALDAVIDGDNVLAVECTNVAGAQFVDAGLVLFWRALPGGAAAFAGAAGAAGSTGSAESAGADYVALAQPGGGDCAAVERALFAPTRAPAVLFAGELDDRQLGPATKPKDLRDVPALLALDLGRGSRPGTFKTLLPQVPGFGDLQVKGTAPPRDAEGRQVLELTIESVKPAAAAAGPDKRFVERHVLPSCPYSFTGRARVVRRFDADGRIAELSVLLTGRLGQPGTGTVAGGPSPSLALELDETWRLARVRANRDAEFQQAVFDAIRRGQGWLAQAITDPRAKPIEPGAQDQRTFASGRLALALLALMQTGFDRDDPCVARAFDELRRRELIDTYSLAAAIMAVEARFAPAGERDDLLHGRIAAPRPRQLPPADREAVQRWTERLLANADTRAAGDVLRFSYVREPRFDHSVNQYALLGLWSASLCGNAVPPDAWRAAARHLLAAQDQGNGKGSGKGSVALRLQSYRRDENARAFAVAPGAWVDRETKGPDGVRAPQYGAMAAAGITSLTLCRAALRALRAPDDDLTARIDQGVRSGFAWIAEHFTARWHPGWIERTFRHEYDWLYGLERACELGGVARFQDRDWYFEGATMLLSWQRDDGSFVPDLHGGEPIERTALAVLFLSKSVLPVLTR